MRTTAKALLLAAAVALAVPVQAQQTRLLTAEKHNEYGLVYSLPVTALRVEVTATRTVRTAGPYYQYAKKYIGTDKVITADSESWTIDRVEVTPYGVPDPDAQYLMQLKPGALTYIAVSDDGMLRAINVEPDDVADTPASAPKAASQMKVPAKDAYLQFVNEDFVASQSSAKQAQMLAESMMEVRESRLSLTRGTADTMPVDGRQMELMLASLAEQEQALAAAFTGTETSETVTRVYTYIPEDGEEAAESEVLFRLSDFGGFVEPDDYSGEPVYISVAVTRRGEMPEDEKGEPKRFPKDGVVYNIPGTALVSMTLGGRTVWERQMEFAQFGTRFALTPSLFTDKRDPSCAVFNPATGALEKLASRPAE